MSKIKDLIKLIKESAFENQEDSLYTDTDNNVQIDDVDRLKRFFPDLHYPTMDNYYNPVKHVDLTKRSCQRCASHDRMHGLRYCRSCYDALRYQNRKVKNAPTYTPVPFEMTKLYDT